MTFRAVIVEDEKPARDRIRRLLASHRDFTVIGEASDGPSAVRLLDETKPDLCFLDVQIPEGDGFDVLRRASHRPHVVFTTAYDQYAVRAFEIHSVDYLLKPVGRQRFAAALDRVRQALRSSAEAEGPSRPATPPARIPARRGARIVLLDPSEILWFEAEENLVFARTREGRVLIERTLSQLEEALGEAFFRAHRAYLVNVSRIAEISPADSGTYRLVMRDAAAPSVPLSRRQAQRLREILGW